MEELPTEMLERIVQLCDHASQKKLRLVNRRVNEQSTPHVFEHFYMGYFTQCLINLDQLSHSYLAKHVRQLTFFADILPYWKPQEWEDVIVIDFRPYDQPGLEEPVHLDRPADLDDMFRHPELSRNRLDIGWDIYTDLHYGQRRWFNDGRSGLFARALTRLPRLTEAHIACASTFRGTTREWPLWKRLRAQILVGPDDWTYSSSVDSIEPTLCLLEGLGHRVQSGASHHITSLKINSTQLVPYKNILYPAAYYPAARAWGRTGPAMPRYRLIMDVFENLTNLQMVIPKADPNEALGRTRSEFIEDTTDLLMAARQLRRLDLTSPRDRRNRGNNRPPRRRTKPDNNILWRILNHPSVVWPHIEHLALAANLNVPAGGLLPFLRHHASTLRSLELRNIFLVDVLDTLEQLPRVLQLESVYVKSVEGIPPDPDDDGWIMVDSFLVLGTDHDDPYERSVRSYLLGEATHLPKLRREHPELPLEDLSENDDDEMFQEEASSDDDSDT